MCGGLIADFDGPCPGPPSSELQDDLSLTVDAHHNYVSHDAPPGWTPYNTSRSPPVASARDPALGSVDGVSERTGRNGPPDTSVSAKLEGGVQPASTTLPRVGVEGIPSSSVPNRRGVPARSLGIATAAARFRVFLAEMGQGAVFGTMACALVLILYCLFSAL